MMDTELLMVYHAQQMSVYGFALRLEPCICALFHMCATGGIKDGTCWLGVYCSLLAGDKAMQSLIHTALRTDTWTLAKRDYCDLAMRTF